MTLPTRRADLIVRSVGDGMIVFDPVTQTAHSLEPLAARVFSLCDASVTESQARSDHGVTATELEQALAALGGAGLLEPQAHISRRALLARSSLVAGGALVFTVAAPLAAVAASAQGGGSGSASLPATGSATPGSTYPSSPGASLTVYTVPFTTSSASQSVTLTGDPVLEFSENNYGIVKYPQVQITLDGTVIASSIVYFDHGDTDNGAQYSYSLGGSGFSGAGDQNDNEGALTTSVATAGSHVIAVLIHDGSAGSSATDDFTVSQGSLTVS